MATAQVSAVVINADWSNRRAPARSPAQLENRLITAVNRAGAPPIVAFSEFSNKGVVRGFQEQTAYAGAPPGQYPGLYLGYDTTLFEPEGRLVDGRHYIGQLLRSIEIRDHLVLAVAVHMPRSKVEANYQCLLNYLEESQVDYGIDSIVVGGDFNQRPEFLVDQFHDMQVSLGKEQGATTQAGRSLDNVIYSDNVDIEDTTVHYDDDAFSHYPIQVEASVEE